MSGLLSVIGGPIGALLKVLFWPVKAVWNWSWADWRQMAITMLVLVLLCHKLSIDDRLRSDVEAARKESAWQKSGKQACEGTVANLKAASVQAKAAQDANLARVQAEHAAINERASDDFEARLAGLRARYERLRGGTAKAHSGLSGASAVPARMAGAAGPVEAAGDTGLSFVSAQDRPFAAGASCPGMTLYERLIASEQAEQLDALIDAVEAQAAVRTGP